MDYGLHTSKPPSTSYRETFRRHRKLLCAPIILGALAAAIFLLFGVTKTYKSTASLWVDTTAPVPSSAGASSTPLAEPPAVAEQAILSELLTTRAFIDSVAKASVLGKQAGGRADAAQLLGNGQLVPTAPGGQVMQISYSASSPALAENVLGAVIAQLRAYTGRLDAQHNQVTLAYDREQVNVAKAALATARGNVTTYQARHPGATHNDANYLSLAAAESNAAQQLSQANNALSQMTASGKTPGWEIQVVDPPSQATATTLRKSKMALIILGGGLAGLLVSFLAVVALTPAKKETWEDEPPHEAPFVPDMLPADPFGPESPRVPAATAESTLATAGAARRGPSLGDRRFQFRTSSAPPEEQ